MKVLFVIVHALNLINHLQVCAFLCVCSKQIFGALDVIGQLHLCQVCPKIL